MTAEYSEAAVKCKAMRDEERVHSGLAFVVVDPVAVGVAAH